MISEGSDLRRYQRNDKLLQLSGYDDALMSKMKTLSNFLYFYFMEVREPAIAYGKQNFSIEEYLEMEKSSIEKHEYYKGEIFAMSGAKIPHSTISKNLLGTLFAKLKGKKMPALR